MTQKISSVNIETSTLSSFTGPTISSIAIANSSYVILDDTAVSNAGGFAVITGSNFASGAQVLFGSTSATAVTFVNSTTLRVQVPALTAGSYVVYVQNGDGSTAIRLNGITSSPIPVWATESTLTSQVDGVPISISLSASSDSSVTYTLANGSSLPSGTTLASNGLFSGTVTGLSNDTTYNFSVNAIDAENQETLRSFSVTVTSGDQNFKDTVLLLNGETSNNTWITDTSTNNFALTVNGDTRPVAFSPYETVWSNYFDGTGDYLSTALTSASPGTGSFTYECWFYVTSLAAVRSIMNTRSGDTADGFDVSILTDGNLYVTYANLVLSNPTSGIVVNRWYHFAIVRNGTTNWNMYLNGVSLSSFTNSSNFTSTTMLIGAAALNGTPFLGYISNFRYTRSAVYTSNFTPPTSPLTAITNTSLLTCQSNRLIDNSTNNFTLTRNGDVAVSNFGPFVETDITTGSGYFDGTGDFLDAGNQTAFAFGTGDFTVECWIYATAASDTPIYEGRANGSTSDGFAITAFSSSVIRIFSGSALISSSGTTYLNQWTHVAVCRVSGTTTLYINGVSVGTTTSLGNNATGSAVIGGGRYAGGTTVNTSFTGYISNFRIIKGTAAYTSNFTPSTSPLTRITNTSLLTLQSRIGENNNRFIDTSGLNNFITRSANTSQGTFSPYQRGGWSNYFDGTGDYLGWSGTTLTGDFTVECWVYKTAVNASGYTNVFSGSGNQQFIIDNTTAGSIGLIVNASVIIAASGTAVTPNAWHHLAWVREGSTCRAYVNGIQQGTGTTSASIPLSLISQFQTGGYGLNGYMSNARIVNGTCLYPGGTTFTPPALPLTPVANTSLLTCADSGFIDDSPNNFTITRYGDVSVQPFSPFKVHTITANTHSVYFDGTGDYLQIPTNNALAFGTGDFTCESWVYISSAPASAAALWGDIRWNAGYNSGWYTHINSNLTVTARIAGSWTEVISSATVNLNRWNHIAVSRQSGTFRLFVNGVLSGSASSSTNYTNAEPFKVGIAFIDGLIFPFTGYISNLRAVKGVAVYTGNFALPNVAPLQLSGTLSANSYSNTTNVNTTFSEANTSLLTCSSNTIIDLSTVNFGNTAYTIAVNGDARPTTVNPLGFTVTNVTGTPAEYSIANEGGSMYFDGTGDYLNCGSNTLNNLGGNFTVEAWVYRAVSGALHPIFNHGDYVGSTGILFYITSGNALAVFTNNGLAMSGGTVSPNTWTHVALVRSGTGSGNLKLYLNGISVGTPATNTATFSGTMLIGADLYNSAISNFMNGYISNLRVLKGTALYTSNFIPSTAPLTPIAGTTLLVNGTNGSIIDYSRKNNLESFDTAILRSNIKRYGNTSIYFAGVDDYLAMPYSPNFNFSTGPFTIECWINFNVLSGNRMIFDTYTAASAGGGYQFYWRSTGGSITFYANGVIVAQSSFNTHATGTWYHVACTRDSSGIVRIFIDGVMYAYTSYTSSIDIATTSRPAVGIQYITGTNDLDAYIDDLRITKGVARYSSNTSFTPPTQTLPIR